MGKFTYIALTVACLLLSAVNAEAFTEAPAGVQFGAPAPASEKTNSKVSFQNTDTDIAGKDSHGVKLGYLLTDNVMGYVDYESMSQSVDGFTTATDANPVRQGVGFGAGIEWAMTDKVDLRLDYVHTEWQSQIFADVETPDDDTGRVALVFRFK